MPIGETIPTIAELKGNTILELFKSGYNALKNALTRKQNKLVAGSNIVINEETNTISAIEGGSVVLDDYYTKTETDDLLDGKANAVNTYNKEEVDELLGDKADIEDVYDKVEINEMLDDINTSISAKIDSDDVYTKTEIDTLIDGEVTSFDAQIVDGTGADAGKIVISTEIKNGDILVCDLGTSSTTSTSCVMCFKEGSDSSVTQAYVNASSGTYYFGEISTKISKLNNVVKIEKFNARVTVTSGTATYSNTQINIYSAYSAIKIYRKKEVTE